MPTDRRLPKQPTPHAGPAKDVATYFGRACPPGGVRTLAAWAVVVHTVPALCGGPAGVFVDPSQAWTVPGLLLQPGNKPSLDCKRLCARRMMAALETALYWPNIQNCTTLKGHFDCSECIERSFHPALPGMSRKTGNCYVWGPQSNRTSGHRVNASYASRRYTRLCPCVSPGELWTQPVRWGGRWTVRLPSDPGGWAPSNHPERVCDTRDTDWSDRARVQACVAYLADTANMQQLVPLVSNSMIGRTVKFRVRYRDRVTAVLKLPQDGFWLEPYAELLAFAADNILGSHLVPPVAAMKVPMNTLTEALDKASGTHRRLAKEEFFTYGKSHGTFFEQNGVTYVNGSLQLWMSDVHFLAATNLWVGSNWKDHLSPGQPTNSLPSDFSPNFTTAVAPQLVRLAVFDYVIGNRDRAVNKNTHVAGGCTRMCEVADDTPAHLGNPKIVAIDQGLSFYRVGEKDIQNPFSPSLYRRLGSLVDGQFLSLLYKVTDPSVFSHNDREHVKTSRLRAAQERLDNMHAHMKSCVERFGDAALPWQ
eukprot:gene168-361_t